MPKSAPNRQYQAVGTEAAQRTFHKHLSCWNVIMLQRQFLSRRRWAPTTIRKYPLNNKHTKASKVHIGLDCIGNFSLPPPFLSLDTTNAIQSGHNFQLVVRCKVIPSSLLANSNRATLVEEKRTKTMKWKKTKRGEILSVIGLYISWALTRTCAYLGPDSI